MYYVYILESVSSGRYYIGSGESVEDRLARHNRGAVSSTKRFKPYVIVFSQRFEDKSLARKIELGLKKLKRKDYLEKVIRDGYIKLADCFIDK